MASLDAFRAAQDDVWPDVVRELTQGQKVTHWIWFVFPQLAALGRSPRAKHFGLQDLVEAELYLSDEILKQRLVMVADLLLTHGGKDARDILGDVDAVKVQSSMTLFEKVPDAPRAFSDVLESFYAGTRCAQTTALLSAP